MYTIVGIDYLNHGTFDPVTVSSVAARDAVLARVDRICEAGGFSRVDEGNNPDFTRYYVSGAGGLEIRIFCFDKYSAGSFNSQGTALEWLEDFAGAFGLDLDTLTPV